MPSIVARLGQPGTRGYYGLARDLMARAKIRFQASDIETGEAEGAARKWGLSKPGLSTCGMEVLLVGFLDENLNYDSWSVGALGIPDERALIGKSLDRLTRSHRNGALNLGYNILGFDFPSLTTRAALLGDARKERWMFPSSPYKMEAQGVCDVLFLTAKSFRLSDAGFSLSSWLKFWGRQELGTGKNFGEAWKQGDDQMREILRHYNRMNLIDTAMIALHSGVLFAGDLPQGLLVDGGSVATSSGECGYSSRAYPIAAEPIPVPTIDFCYLVPITMPERGLKENGPLGEAWPEYFKNHRYRPRDGVDAAIDSFPFREQYEGRWHPFWHRLVGFAIISPSGMRCVLHPENEEIALQAMLDEADRWRGRCPLHVPDRLRFLRMVHTRATRLGLVLNRWVIDSRRSLWKDNRDFAPWEQSAGERSFDPNILARARGWLPFPKMGVSDLSYEHDVSLPPLWLKQKTFGQEIETHLRVMANYISISPALH